MPREERGVSFGWKTDEVRMLAAVRWGESSAEIIDRGGWRMEIDVREIPRHLIDARWQSSSG